MADSIAGEPRPAPHSTTGQLWRFGIIGTLGFIADSAALKIALKFLGLGLYSGRLFSFLVAATCTWALNRRFTFIQARDQGPIVQWLRFLGANAVGGAVNISVYFALISFVPFVKANPIAGVAVGSIAGMVFNFAANKFWVFRAKH